MLVKNTVSTIQRRSCWIDEVASIEEEESTIDDGDGTEAIKSFRIERRYWMSAS